MLEGESFLGDPFNDACSPPECEHRIKINTSSDTKLPSTQIVFSFNQKKSLQVTANMLNTSSKNNSNLQYIFTSGLVGLSTSPI